MSANNYQNHVTASSNLVYYFTFDSNDFTSDGSETVVEGTNLFSASANYAFNIPSLPDNQGPDGDPPLDVLGTGEAFYITASAAIFNDRTFTISGWFRAPDDNSKRTILHVTGGSHSELCIHLTNAGVLTADLTDESNTKKSVTADSYDTSNQTDNDLWHHFNVSSDASNLKISLNGGPFKDVAHSGGALSLDYNDIYVGAHNDGTHSFAGALSHIAIYSDTNLSRELYLAGAETYPYEYILGTWMPKYQFSATNDTSNTHPVDNLGSQSLTTSSGVFYIESGGPSASAYLGEKGYFFDRSGTSTLNAPVDNNGISVINQGTVLFDNTNGWMYHTWFKSASVNVYAGGPALARNPGNFTAQQMIIRVNGSGAGGPGDSGKIQAYIGGKSLYSASAIYHDGEWHHVAWGAAGGTLRLWVDGQFVASTAVSQSVNDEANRRLYIGRGDHSSVTQIDERWYGWIDESHFYQPPGGIGTTEATTSATDFYRLGLYQHSITPPVPVTASGTPMTASALFVDPTISTVFQISYSASPFTADALMTSASVGLSALITSELMTASALMTSASVDVTIGIDFSASALLVTSAEFISPSSISVGTSVDNFGVMTASALAVDPTLTLGTGHTASADPVTASALMPDPNVIAVQNTNITSYGSKILDKNPTVYLPFDNVYGTEISGVEFFNPNRNSVYGSSSVTVSTGTITNEIPFINSGGIFGYPSVGLVFAFNDFVSYTDSVAGMSGDQTISFWRNAARFDCAIYLGWGDLTFYKSSTSNYLKLVINSSGVGTVAVSNNVLGPGYIHIAVTIGGGELKIYLDGVLDSTHSFAGASGTGARIGPVNGGIESGGYFQLDEFATFNRVLTDDEIADIATKYTHLSQAVVTGLPEPLVTPTIGAPPLTASALMVDPTISTTFAIDVTADPMTAEAAGNNVIIDVASNINVVSAVFAASGEFSMPTIDAQRVIDFTADAALASASAIDPTIYVETFIDFFASPASASALSVEPTVLTQKTVNITASPMLVLNAEFGDLYSISTGVNYSASFMSAENAYLPEPIITAIINVSLSAAPMLATATLPKIIKVNGNDVWLQAHEYQQAIADIGAEIYIAKTIVTDNTWTDYNNNSSSANFVFGINNVTDAVGTTSSPRNPVAAAVLTCNETKWGGVFTGSATNFMNFYPTYDRYGTSLNPSQTQLTGNEDWRYVEFTGPWFYTTTEDSYELIFSTTESNQILLSGQTTYTLSGENNTNTLEDDTRVNTYIEYGLDGGKVYVKFYPSLSEDPITITGNTNIADGQDHHIVMQRTSASGMYRDKYVLNMDIGNVNQWSTLSGSGIKRHAVVGPQEITDKFYADPITGEIFHGFEIWIDGELDVRSASFNSTHIAPIVKSLGGRTYITQTQEPAGNIVNSRFSTSGINGTLTSIVGRFNTESINALSSYNVDIADMPRFPQEAKILRHAALDPDTIGILADLALGGGKEAAATLSTASATMPNASVSTNLAKILRLYWNGPDTVGTNFGTSFDGQDYIVDTYSVLYELSNNPSHVYNVDAADRDGLADPEAAAEPVVVDRWKDANGTDRLLNINTDIDLSEYETIIFMDYPDNSDEIDAILPNNTYVYIQSQLNDFIDRLKTAVINGKSLYVSSPTLAIKLGLIAKETVIEQTYDANDVVSASINPFITTASPYFDTHRNNRYELVKQIDGITNTPGFIMTDVISYARDLYDEYHIKYDNRSNGLQVGDQFLIPGLPITPSQLNRDYAGYTNNRIVNLHVIDPIDIVSGDVIAKLAGTNYITTMALKPGDLLGESRISGKIFVNFVEDALTLGLEDYNYGVIQTGFTSRTTDETSQTVQWQYSTSRTTRKLSAATNIITTRGLNGQTTPTDGGGGPIVQAPTSSTFGNISIDHDSDNETFVSSIYFDPSSERYPTNRIFVPSMTLRGIDWLTSYSYANKTNVGVEPMTASASMPDATTTDTIILAGPATVSVVPATAAAEMREKSNAIWVNQNRITLTMYVPETINLYIQKEVSS